MFFLLHISTIHSILRLLRPTFRILFLFFETFLKVVLKSLISVMNRGNLQKRVFVIGGKKLENVEGSVDL